MSPPRTSTATPFSTVISIAHVSGQSCGQAALTTWRVVAGSREFMAQYYATTGHRREKGKGESHSLPPSPSRLYLAAMAFVESVASVPGIPVTVHVMPARSSPLPAVRHPDVSRARREPVTLDPDVPVTVPRPVARRPHVARRRRRGHDDGWRRRTDRDTDTDARVGLAGGRRQRYSGGDQQAQQQIFRAHDAPPFCRRLGIAMARAAIRVIAEVNGRRRVRRTVGV